MLLNIYFDSSLFLPLDLRCSIACKTIGGTWGKGELRADLSTRYEAEADDDKRVRASISRDFQLVDSEGVSLLDLLPVSWLEISFEDLELCERLEPDESRLIFSEASVTSWVEAVDGVINGVPSLTFLGDFFDSAQSGGPWGVTALWRGIANTPFSKEK